MKTILVIFGGQSAEHDVSIITALNSVIKPLEMTKKYTVLPLYIAKDGNWYCDLRLSDIDLYASGKIDSFIKKIKPVNIQFSNGLEVNIGKSLNHQKIKIDLVFPAMHGTHGEDGDLMGLLEMANVPYVGCDVSASNIAMNKVLSKQLAEYFELPVSRFLSFRKNNSSNNLSDQEISGVEKKLSYPLFVKPAHLGSSIGISRVENKSQLVNAVEVAFYYDDLIIVEEEVGNLVEVTLPIIGNDQPVPSLLERPLVQSGDFFDFETKYLKGGKKGGKNNNDGAQGYSQIPAVLPKNIYVAAEKLALDVYCLFGLSGIARIDMLIDIKTSKVYFNEINPLPGSLYSHNFQKFGMSNVQLVEKLLQLAQEKFEQKNKLQKIFKTNYLKQF